VTVTEPEFEFIVTEPCKGAEEMSVEDTPLMYQYNTVPLFTPDVLTEKVKEEPSFTVDGAMMENVGAGPPEYLVAISTSPANTLSLPLEATTPFRDGVGEAVVSRTFLKSLRFAVGKEDRKEANAPVTWGVAIEVPLMD
jgi:hypothetical protein